MFSIDVEDPRDHVPRGDLSAQRVPLMLPRYLEFLNGQGMKATFFVVGSVAKKYPSLIREIASEGHEVGAHGNNHLALERLGKEGFREDLKRNMEHLDACGVRDVLGYRAPMFSLTKTTQWAYEILEDSGFRYSSSVLPALNPLYGWPEFGRDVRKVNNLWEIPISVAPFRRLAVPYAGGVYFRVIPFWLILYFCKRSFRRETVIRGYFHPYDIDTEEEAFTYPGIAGFRLFNYLIYYRRDSVLKRLAMILERTNCDIIPYIDFVRTLSGKENAIDRQPRT